VAEIHVPTLVMSGGSSYPFLGVIDRYLAAHIPQAQAVTYPGASHQMWMQRPEQARAATEAFFKEH
jgi:pimeloyl-ACP methyl ester carboxylesterase